MIYYAYRDIGQNASMCAILIPENETHAELAKKYFGGYEKFLQTTDGEGFEFMEKRPTWKAAYLY
jgi:hypothetical protein